MTNDTALDPTASRADMPLRTPVIVPLPELGVIRVSGPDAIAFLQAQLTNDVAGQAENTLRLSGYCSAKGRLLATFHQWRTNDAVWLRLPREIVAPVVKRLTMFVLRAKAKVEDASDQFATCAVIGPGSGAALQRVVASSELKPYESASEGAVRVDRLPASRAIAERYLLTLAADAPSPDPVAALPRRSAELWWWSEIDAAIPTVFAATQEKFVPQMINFEVLGGVNFRKGCYPGQEVVARSQYLGKLKRRMHIAHVDGAPPPPATDLVRPGAVQPAGTVVMAASAPGGGTDLLFEAPSDQLGVNPIHLAAPDGPLLDIQPLPYALFDPTA